MIQGCWRAPGPKCAEALSKCGGPPGSPFQVGHTMEIVGLDGEDEMMGIIVEAKEKGRIGHLPLADLEVKPKTDKNYWPVREYVMWFGNR